MNEEEFCADGRLRVKARGFAADLLRELAEDFAIMHWQGEDEVVAGISRRSIEKAKLDIKALERSGADPMEVMADLNRTIWRIIVDSIKAERAEKNLSEEELLQICRKIALLGRRDAPRP